MKHQDNNQMQDCHTKQNTKFETLAGKVKNFLFLCSYKIDVHMLNMTYTKHIHKFYMMVQIKKSKTLCTVSAQ